MRLEEMVTVVTGGASGLGLATAQRLIDKGAKVVIFDLPGSAGEAVRESLGHSAVFVAGDVTREDDVRAAFAAAEAIGPVRGVVHCAGRGGPLRILDRDGEPGALAQFEAIVRVNLVGSFNVLRLAAASIARSVPVEGERGAIILTASVAAFEGQIGQIPYAASKAGVVGMTIVAARDLASRLIRVCTIAPGTFETPLLARLSDAVRHGLAEAVPHPRRLGAPDEFAMLACQILENPMLNGETIRLDGAIRMPPR